ncbi:MAG: type II toxin-antitoxin system death-on-curing family toxin, partial [Sarcina sp.]
THSLISNYGFIDGNKRIGVIVLDVLSSLNDIELNYTQKDLIDLGLSVAEGKYDDRDIYNWIIKHKVKPIKE